MRFPIERFNTLPFSQRMDAIDAWNRAREWRYFASLSRRRGDRNDALFYIRGAMRAVRSVKFWAEKAKEIHK